MKRAWMAVALLGVTALAADSKEQRLLKFASDTYKGDVRNGPYTFTGTASDPSAGNVPFELPRLELGNSNRLIGEPHRGMRCSSVVTQWNVMRGGRRITMEQSGKSAPL